MDLKASINSIPYLQYMTEQLSECGSELAAGVYEETGSEEESSAAADPNS